ncbi:unnamed protein product [Amoebophrya sp. A25]|nr:unnamed protein product [Amoebophrya sp. A25]|eukprot:GSA25T00021428001.1
MSGSPRAGPSTTAKGSPEKAENGEEAVSGEGTVAGEGAVVSGEGSGEGRVAGEGAVVSDGARAVSDDATPANSFLAAPSTTATALAVPEACTSSAAILPSSWEVSVSSLICFWEAGIPGSVCRIELLDKRKTKLEQVEQVIHFEDGGHTVGVKDDDDDNEKNSIKRDYLVEFYGLSSDTDFVLRVIVDKYYQGTDEGFVTATDELPFTSATEEEAEKPTSMAFVSAVEEGEKPAGSALLDEGVSKTPVADSPVGTTCAFDAASSSSSSASSSAASSSSSSKRFKSEDYYLKNEETTATADSVYPPTNRSPREREYCLSVRTKTHCDDRRIEPNAVFPGEQVTRWLPLLPLLTYKLYVGPEHCSYKRFALAYRKAQAKAEKSKTNKTTPNNECTSSPEQDSKKGCKGAKTTDAKTAINITSEEILSAYLAFANGFPKPGAEYASCAEEETDRDKGGAMKQLVQAFFEQEGLPTNVLTTAACTSSSSSSSAFSSSKRKLADFVKKHAKGILRAGGCLANWVHRVKGDFLYLLFLEQDRELLLELFAVGCFTLPTFLPHPFCFIINPEKRFCIDLNATTPATWNSSPSGKNVRRYAKDLRITINRDFEASLRLLQTYHENEKIDIPRVTTISPAQGGTGAVEGGSSATSQEESNSTAAANSSTTRKSSTSPEPKTSSPKDEKEKTTAPSKTWLTEELLKTLSELEATVPGPNAPPVHQCVFEFWEGEELVALCAGFAVGNGAYHDYSMCTLKRDHRSLGHIASKTVGHILRVCGFQLWYWGCKIGYMSQYEEKYGGRDFPRMEFADRWSKAASEDTGTEQGLEQGHKTRQTPVERLIEALRAGRGVVKWKEGMPVEKCCCKTSHGAFHGSTNTDTVQV